MPADLEITDEQLHQLRDEALRYSDDFMVQLCDRALSGSAGHRECCALTLRDEDDRSTPARAPEVRRG